MSEPETLDLALEHREQVLSYIRTEASLLAVNLDAGEIVRAKKNAAEILRLVRSAGAGYVEVEG